MNYKSFFKDEKGAVLPIVAILLGFVFIGFSALVVDVGMLYSEKKQMVTAADSGALAGAMVLEESGGLNTALAESVAIEYAKKNGADPSKVDVDFETRGSDNRQVIVVKVGVNKELFFAKIFGKNNADVEAIAVATWGYVKKVAAGGILPIFITDTLYAPNSAALLHEGKLIVNATDYSGIAHGNWGFLKVFPSDNKIALAMAGEFTDVNLEINEILENAQGNKVSSVDSIKFRMQHAKTLSSIDEQKRYMSGLVPVISEADIEVQGSNLRLPIDLFGVYIIEDYITAISKDNITGKWSPIGSVDALSFTDDAYPKDIVAPTKYGEFDTKELAEEAMPVNTILGHFTDVKIELDPITVIGDQIMPFESVPITYHKLIE